MKTLFALISILFSFHLFAQVSFKASISFEKGPIYKYSNHSKVSLNLENYDTLKHEISFWIDNNKSVSYKMRRNFINYSPLTDSAYAKYQIFDKHSKKLLFFDSILLTFQLPPKFNPEWETMEMYDVLKEIKKFDYAITNNYVFSRWLGRKLPEVQFSLLNGEKYDLKSSTENKQLFIDFTSLACGPCLQEEKSLDSLSKLEQNKNIEFVMLYDFIYEKAEKRFSFRSTNFKFALSDKFYNDTIGLRAAPCKMITDKKGIIRFIEFGAYVIKADGKEIKKEEINPYILSSYSDIIKAIEEQF